MTEVVVTGVGAVTSLGVGNDRFWAGLVDGRSAAGPITMFDPSGHPVRFACEVRDFEPEKFMPLREASRMDRFSQFALAAGQMALADAGLEEEAFPVPPERFGAIVGSGMTGVWSQEKDHAAFLTGGPRKVGPLAAIKFMANAGAANLSLRYGLQGPSYAVVSACATGANSIGDAMLYIKSGMADMMLAGASDGGITPLWAAVFAKMGALSTRNDEPERASRPFDVDRDGFVLGEGAGILVLERRDLAEKRGAPILCELAGYGSSGDAYHLSQPHPEGRGSINSMRGALAMAGVPTDGIGVINPHGTSTLLNDRVETRAIKEVFGTDAKKIAISATKSQLGHAMGAAGAVEAVATILSMKHSLVPATINLENPDPECDLDYVADGPRELNVRAAISNSFGLGGHCSSLLFRAVS